MVFMAHNHSPSADTGSKPDAGAKQSATPGRPKDSGSRQQTQPGQSAQTGSTTLDKEMSKRTGAAPMPKPPGAK
jgi:hypothetical protein